MSLLFTSGGQRTRASASSISPSNEYSGLISFRIDCCSPRDPQEPSLTPQFKSINSLALNLLYDPILTSMHVATGKIIALTRQTFVSRVNVSAFEYVVQVVIAFLPRSKCLLISWLQSPFAVILKPSSPKIKSVTIVSPSICHEVMRLDVMIFVF